MTLDDWMSTTKTPNATFGARLGTSGETIRRYRNGERWPDAETMAEIFALTDGLVTPNDWVGVGPHGSNVSHEQVAS